MTEIQGDFECACNYNCRPRGVGMSAAAAAQTYDCKIDTARPKDFVKNRILVVIDEELGAAKVLDPLISAL